MSADTPFTLLVTGRAEIPHPAERALINVSISSTGPNQTTVSTEVISTAKIIESHLHALSPQDRTASAKATAALSHWSKTSLSSTSHIPYNYKEPHAALPRQYRASINFDIRFREFQALGAFGTKLSMLKHVEVKDIEWKLTDATEQSFRQELRRQAARDALQKAEDYCGVLGYVDVRAVELHEGDVRSSMASGRGFGGGNAARSAAPRMQLARTAPEDPKVGDLWFDAQEVNMAMDVTVKFHADREE